MICYTLRCADQHAFDSWFQSAAAYDALAQAGRLACPVCGSVRVEKSLMAPAVRADRTAHGPEAEAAAPVPPAEVRQALAALRRHVEENADYVGTDFVREARAIHDGDAPARAIYGEARGEDARKLIEDGVPVAALPFVPLRKVN